MSIVGGLVFLMCAAGGAHGQDLEETLSQLGSAYAQAYTEPLGDALGANINSGLFHSADVSSNRFGFRIFVGVHAFGAFLTEDDETFDLDFAGRVNLTADVGGEHHELSVPATFSVDDAPTVFGSEEPAVATVTARVDTTLNRFGVAVPVSFDTTFTQEIVGGVMSTNVVPWLVPQVRVGTAYGTDLTIRWLPQLSMSDLGTLGLVGVGVRHSISQYTPQLPVSVAVQIGWQRVTFDDDEAAELVRVTAFAASLAVSHRLGPLDVYGALQTERATFDVRYEVDATDAPGITEPVVVDFEQTGAVRGRGILGLGLHLGPLVLNGSYSISRVNVVSVGLGVSL